MALKDLSPRAEPVGWALIVASALAALGSYGFNLTDELEDFILLVSPFILTGIAARFAVFAPDTVREIQKKAHEAGKPPTEPIPDLPTPPGGDEEVGEESKKDWGIYNIDDDEPDVKGIP